MDDLKEEEEKERVTKYDIAMDGFSSIDPRNMKSVEIIVPFYNTYSSVAKLLEAIFSTIRTNRYQVTLVDDGSKNKSFIKDLSKKKIAGLNCLQKEENQGFGAAVNHALKNSNNPWIPYVCILHSDVLPDDTNWLTNIGSCLQKLKSQNVKMVSARSNCFNDDLRHLETKKEQKSDDYILNINEYLPMFCSICHRDLFKFSGYFQEYKYAGYESQEYALRMNKSGFKQAIAGNSWIHHDGKGTINTLSSESKEILRKDHDVLKDSLNKYLSTLNIVV